MEKLIAELRETYQHLTFEQERDGIRAHFSKSSSMWLGKDEPDDWVTAALVEGEAVNRECARLKELYPHLYFYLDKNTLKPMVAWVMRHGRDAEALGTRPTKDNLAELNEKARLAKRDGWFLCTGCNEPKSKSEYAYFYFAGMYCKACKEANPGHYRRAVAESYN